MSVPGEVAVTQRDTERLVLRQWTNADRRPFSELNADAEVMAHFPAPLTRVESDTFVDKISAHLTRHDWGPWAVDVADRNQPALSGFAGMVGLWTPSIGPWLAEQVDDVTEPVVEVGWRLARTTWGHGYATEAASAAIGIAFSEIDVDRVVAFTSTQNSRSIAVMERIGMTRIVAGDFDHPDVPDGHALRPHVLYMIRR